MADVMAELHGYSESRPFFEDVARKVRRLSFLHEVMIYGLDAVQPGQGGGKASGVPDPTAGRALAESSVVEAARAEACAIEDAIGAALALIEGVRRGLGEAYADVLERHYVDGASFSDVADEMGITKMTAINRRDVACDWVDMVGWRRALHGFGKAEG